MTMLTVRQMRYFEALADALHFGRAAHRLNITQPALSGQIAQMEADFAVRLFERRPSGVILTPEGDAIRQRIRRIMGEIRDLEAMAGRREGLTGQLRLGVIASVAPYLLPELLPRASTRFPGLDLGLKENVTERLLADLSAGSLDCALVALPVTDPSFRIVELVDDPFYLAVPSADAARIASPVRPQALVNERLILLEEGHCMRDQALAVCKIVETRDLASLGATSLATLLRMVAGRLGVTLAPLLALAAEGRNGGIDFLPFHAPQPIRRLALAYRASSGREPGFAALGECIAGVLADEQARSLHYVESGKRL